MKSDHGPLGKSWTDIGSDVNWSEYGGRWARHIEGTRYHVIRFENCAEWGDGATGYHCDLQEVDACGDNVAAALECCDMPLDGLDEYGAAIPSDAYVMMKVYAMSSYGAYAPLWQDAGKNAHKLLRAAKRESRLLSTNAVEYEARMDRPVNKIGSTAREYAAGDMHSAILRGVSEGRPDAELMLKIMGGGNQPRKVKVNG